MSLPPLFGHDEARARLLRAMRAGTLPQSILLHGPAGVGKERLGLWLAQLLVCEAPDEVAGPCDRCLPCRLTVRLEHPDVHWFFPLPRPEGASADRLREKLEEARATELQARRERPHHPPAFDKAPAHFLASILNLQQRAAVRPAMGRRKVFVVGDSELMVPQEASPEAANAFLKLLEEPPADTVVVLTSSQPGALLPTIRSRVLPLRLAPLPESTVRDYLVEAGVETEQAGRIARTARGAVGRALRLLPADGAASPLDALRQTGRSLLLAALSTSATPRFAAGHARRPTGGRGEFSAELEALSEWLRDLLAVASGAPEQVADPEAVRLLQRAVEQYRLHPLAVAAALQRISAALEMAAGNANPQLILIDLLQRVHGDLRAA